MIKRNTRNENKNRHTENLQEDAEQKIKQKKKKVEKENSPLFFSSFSLAFDTIPILNNNDSDTLVAFQMWMYFISNICST